MKIHLCICGEQVFARYCQEQTQKVFRKSTLSRKFQPGLVLELSDDKVWTLAGGGGIAFALWDMGPMPKR